MFYIVVFSLFLLNDTTKQSGFILYLQLQIHHPTCQLMFAVGRVLKFHGVLLHLVTIPASNSR